MKITLYLKVWAHRITERIGDKGYKGENVPAPAMLKRKTVADYAKKYKCDVLVETGTYLGEMVEFQAKNFKKVFSIEIADLFYQFSSRRLKKYKNISIIKGDSGTSLKSIMKEISPNDRILFWLDGHYSGGKTGKGEKDCPIYEELACIFLMRQNKDIILIDDARCFNGNGDYPTLSELNEFIKKNRKNAGIEVKHDIIRVTLI